MTAEVTRGEASPALWSMHLALMATMVVWALNVTVIKWLVTVMDAMQSATLRMGFAALTLLVLVYVSRQRLPLFRGRVLLLACCSSLLMVYASQLLFVSAMTRTTASNASLLLALNPLLNGVMEALFFRKRLRAHYLVGLTITLTGVCLAIFNNPEASWGAPALGDLLVLGSMLAFALGVVILQILSQRNVEHPGQISLNTFIYTVGSLALLLHICLMGDMPLSEIAAQPGQVWLILAFSGAGVTALGAIAWGRGVATIGAGQAAVYMSWVPVLGVAFGALVLKEPLTVWHFIAMVAVVLGTALCNLGSIRQPRQTLSK